MKHRAELLRIYLRHFKTLWLPGGQKRPPDPLPKRLWPFEKGWDNKSIKEVSQMRLGVTIKYQRGGGVGVCGDEKIFYFGSKRYKNIFSTLTVMEYIHGA